MECDGGLFKCCLGVDWPVFLSPYHLEVHLLYSKRDKLNKEVKNAWPKDQ